MFNKVLAPVDIAEFELAASILPYVSRLSKDLGLPVVLLSALNPDNVQVPESLGNRPEETSSQVLQNARTEVRRQLNRLVSRLAEEGIDVSCDVAVGAEPAKEILNFAEAQECDLIAIATHDRSLMGQAVMGSVTNEVARSANVPVLAITPEKSDVIPEQRVAISRIIVPLDGTPFSEAVLPYVEYLAQKMPLNVTLVRVVAPTDVYPAGAGGVTPVVDTGVSATELYQIAEEDAIEYLRSTAARVESVGISVSWELLRGSPSAHIADLAEETSDGMIALASHGRSGLMRWVMGSVAEDLLRNTGNPVLIIPSQVAEKAQT